MTTKLLPLFLLLASCGQLVPPLPLTVHCHRALPCDDEDLAAVEQVVADKEPSLNTSEPLTVNEYDMGVTFPGVGPGVVGFTTGPNEVTVTSTHVMLHELYHVVLWRNTGDGDANHEQAPGPWTAAINDEVQALCQTVVDR